MFFKRLFGRSAPERDAAANLYRKAVEKARDPRFYLGLGVADTVDGRFDMIVVHAMLVMRCLRAGDGGARRVSQELFDFMFQDMDRSLREMGVGDLSVGKHIKKMAKAFYSRADVVETALDGVVGTNRALLVAALEQTIYRATPQAAGIVAMADYLVRADQYLRTQDIHHIARGEIDFNVPVDADGRA